MLTCKYIAKEKDTAHFSSHTVIWKFINKQNVGFPRWNCDTINVFQRAMSFITHVTNAWTNAWCKILSLVWIVERRWVSLNASSYCSTTRSTIKAIWLRLQWIYLQVKSHNTLVYYTHYRYNNSKPLVSNPYFFLQRIWRSTKHVSGAQNRMR